MGERERERERERETEENCGRKREIERDTHTTKASPFVSQALADGAGPCERSGTEVLSERR